MKKIYLALPKIILSTGLWLVVIYMVVMVEPSQVRDVLIEGLYLPFIACLGVASWYSALVLTKSFRFAIQLSLLMMGATLIMIMGWMNWMIGVALGGLLIVIGLTLVKQS